MSQPDGESSLVARCLQGDVDALAELLEKYHGPLLRILLSRWGMNRTEAEDLLADLWGDCVPGNVDRPSILEKFSGEGSLQSWLSFTAREMSGSNEHNRDTMIAPGIEAFEIIELSLC